MSDQTAAICQSKISLPTLLIASKAYLLAIFAKVKEAGFGKMITRSDAKTLADMAFEIDKRFGKLKAQANTTKAAFEAKMQNRLEALTKEQRDDFVQGFNARYNERVCALSIKEAETLGITKKDEPKEKASND
ncbi:DUF1104 domain-containing protein [Campylobacter curvus]|uniref:DUF1104 domain-containing protein n=1 Tax=Campylobacter curvus (strain 525.92) TaxID=360105 RepID=A7GXV6_CAMC5|nr:DUF1104 domain-containing protein [Campylobacter curvus]EAU00233.1 putative protein (DUF1104 domain) [Campylobacter curvus 525.92]